MSVFCWVISVHLLGVALSGLSEPFPVCFRMKRMKGGEEVSNARPSESPPEACKKARTQTSEEAAGESRDCDWSLLPQELLLHIFQHLPLLDRAYASQVCRGWNQAFHMPELWRCFEFELNQPASSYLKATHPDLIKQIIKRHSNHLQYVSFKVQVQTCLWSLAVLYKRNSLKSLPSCYCLCLSGGQ